MKQIFKSDPALISRFSKERFLLQMDEDRFRDRIVRPLFLRLGYKDGRDLCGPTEYGKDTVFIDSNKLGCDEIIAVQTKKGKLTLSRKAGENIVEATTQIKTALSTKIPFIKTKTKEYPTTVILCASGKINESAKEHIINEVGDPRIRFLDVDELISLIDKNVPELWNDIDIELLPYLRGLKQMVEEITPESYSTDIISRSHASDSATDEMYVNLRLNRTDIKLRKINGKMERVPFLEEFPVQALIKNKNKRIMINGEGGSGKSTALRRLTYIIAKKSIENNNNQLIPIFLRATEIQREANTQKPLIEICHEEVRRIANTKQSCFSEDDAKNGKLLLMIDGLDELAEIEVINSILDTIDNFHKEFSECKIIITSRDYSYITKLEKLKGFVKYKISPISYREVDSILKRYEKKKNLSKESSKEILRRIEQIHGMDLNPLLVTVFAATTEYSRQDIPANVTELFKKFTEMMLGRWDASKGLSQQYQAPLKDFILKHVAFHMHCAGETNITIAQFQEIIKEELETRGYETNTDEITHELLYRSNLFRIVQDSVEFRHHILQEFFAGRAIPNIEFLKEKVSDYWWQRGIVFYFGENPESIEQLKELTEYLNKSDNADLFVSTITLGLSLQASYMIKIHNKVEIYDWLIGQLSGPARKHYFENVNNRSRPLSKFLGYYIYGREAVSCNFTTDLYLKMLEERRRKIIDRDELDLNDFWIIIALIESGKLSEAGRLIHRFRPNDSRLLLAVHLGCFLIQNLRVSSNDQKTEATKILSDIESRVLPFRQQLLQEFTSELLEIRQNEIKALE